MPEHYRRDEYHPVPGSVRIYCTAAHTKPTVLGQALLAKRMGKTEIIAETGAGQHGVASALASALLGLKCRIYMGAKDVERQSPNVFRMRLMGAEVIPVHSGSATLKDACNEALRDWSGSYDTAHYMLGTAAGPHPFPTIVREFQRMIGEETKVQILEKKAACRMPSSPAWAAAPMRSACLPISLKKPVLALLGSNLPDTVSKPVNTARRLSMAAWGSISE